MWPSYILIIADIPVRIIDQGPVFIFVWWFNSISKINPMITALAYLLSADAGITGHPCLTSRRLSSLHFLLALPFINSQITTHFLVGRFEEKKSNTNTLAKLTKQERKSLMRRRRFWIQLPHRPLKKLAFYPSQHSTTQAQQLIRWPPIISDDPALGGKMLTDHYRCEIVKHKPVQRKDFDFAPNDDKTPYRLQSTVTTRKSKWREKIHSVFFER